MKKKVIFWAVMILANLAIGAISVKTFRNFDARINSVESYQENWARYQSYYNLADLKLSDEKNKKNIAELVRILGVDGKYDFNNNLVRIWDLNKFFGYNTYVRTSLVMENSEELMELNPNLPEKFTRINESPAIVIGQYVLMASHTSDAEVLRRQAVRINTPIGVFEQILELKVLEYKAELLAPDGSKYSLKELYRNKEKDFSLFELLALQAGGSKNAKVPNFPFEIGKSDELRIGNFTYLNGRPAIKSEVARPGFVTSLVSAVSDETLGVKKNVNEFGISQSTDNGDSGSPAMAFRDGRPELVGIYLGWTFKESGDNGNNTRSRALKINAAVDEIKEKLGLDLRELQRQILNNH